MQWRTKKVMDRAAQKISDSSWICSTFGNATTSRSFLGIATKWRHMADTFWRGFSMMRRRKSLRAVVVAGHMCDLRHVAASMASSAKSSAKKSDSTIAWCAIRAASCSTRRLSLLKSEWRSFADDDASELNSSVAVACTYALTEYSRL